MLSKETILLNEEGLHVRPAQLLVKEAGRFQSRLTMNADGNQEIDLKSILGIMTLGLAKGDKVTVSAEGEDEEEALHAIINLIESKFGEEDGHA